MVERYLEGARVVVAVVGETVVGEYVLARTAPDTAEVMNLAVEPSCEGRGIGRVLLEHAIASARSDGRRRIEIGTGNAGLRQLGLYQRAGFRMESIDRDFFVRHYPEPIIENGIPCRDMVRLGMDLAPAVSGR
jgi:ribosomal protein S18 acetylase RimI-like enzyme